MSRPNTLHPTPPLRLPASLAVLGAVVLATLLLLPWQIAALAEAEDHSAPPDPPVAPAAALSDVPSAAAVFAGQEMAPEPPAPSF